MPCSLRVPIWLSEIHYFEVEDEYDDSWKGTESFPHCTISPFPHCRGQTASMAFRLGEYLGNYFTPDVAQSYHNHQNDDKNTVMMIKWHRKDSLVTSALGDRQILKRPPGFASKSCEVTASLRLAELAVLLEFGTSDSLEQWNNCFHCSSKVQWLLHRDCNKIVRSAISDYHLFFMIVLFTQNDSNEPDKEISDLLCMGSYWERVNGKLYKSLVEATN